METYYYLVFYHKKKSRQNLEFFFPLERGGHATTVMNDDTTLTITPSQSKARIREEWREKCSDGTPATITN